MCVFALDERLLLAVVFAIFNTTFIIGIHRTVNIGLAVIIGLFVLYGTARVFGLDPVVGSFEIRTVSGFVTQRPEDDARVVETALYVALVAFQMRFLIRRILGQRGFLIAHTVRFYVGFCHYIDTVFITEFIPVIVIGVVTGTDRIQVELLHDLDVLEHAFA